MNGAIITIINGAPAEGISVADRGLHYGDGLFETILYRRGQLCLFRLHMDRLVRGAEKLSIRINRQGVESDIRKVCEHLSSQNVAEAVIKIILTRGVSGRGYKVQSSAQPTSIVIAYLRTNPEPAWQYGVDVRVCTVRLAEQPVLAGVKHLNRLENVLARSEWDDEFHEGLMCDQRERVVEGTMSNVFFFQNDSLVTPPVDLCGVAGVVRRCIVEQIAPALSIRVRVAPVTIESLSTMTGGFLTNSLIGIAPIKTLAGRVLEIPSVVVALQNALDTYRESAI